MMQTRVVTGDWTKGDHKMKAAPPKNASENYDSVVDDVANPTIYVAFHDVAAYPDYIIKYR